MLPGLQVLDLSHNQLAELPACLTSAPGLATISAGHNRISRIAGTDFTYLYLTTSQGFTIIEHLL